MKCKVFASVDPSKLGNRTPVQKDYRIRFVLKRIGRANPDYASMSAGWLGVRMANGEKIERSALWV